MSRCAKSPFVAALLLAVLAALFAGWSISQEKKPPGNSAALAEAKAAAEEAILKILDQPTEFSFNDTPLSEVLGFLAKKHKLQFIIDRNGLDDSGLNPDKVVIDRSLKGVRLESALNLILGQIGLDWVIRHEVMMITSRDKADTHHVVNRVYPVADMLVPRGQREYDEDELDYDSLIDLIKRVVRSDSWEESGGPGSISAFRGTLFVSQTWRAHREVGVFLDLLRRVCRQQDEAKREGRFAPIDVQTSPADEKIHAALRVKTSVTFAETPLLEVAGTLTKQNGIEVALDRKHLEDAGVTPEKVTVTLRVSDVTLGSALQLMLEPLRMNWVIKDEAILITSKDYAEEYLTTRMYPVRDIAGDDGDLESLEDSICSTVSPDTWDGAGGRGTLTFFVPGAHLVIHQTREAHEQTEEVLAHIRKAMKANAAALAALPKSDEPRVQAYFLAPDTDGKVNAKLVEATAKLVKEAVTPESWTKTPGAFVRALPDRLVVRQTADIHRKVRRFLKEIKVLDLYAHGDSFVPPPRSSEPAGFSNVPGQ